MTDVKEYALPWFLRDLPGAKVGAPTVLSTFASGGGSTMGYKLAGFDVVGANDIDPQMAANYQRNFQPLHYFLQPISELVKSAKAENLPKEFYALDVLDGSPPCSSFSLAGAREASWGKQKMFREGQAAQVLDDLFFDYLDLVAALRPKVSIAENVEGMLHGNARWYVQQVLRRYESLDYSVQLFSLNGADYGVPQARQRVFFVAVDKAYKAKHALKKLVLPTVHTKRSVRAAFQNLPVLEFAQKDEQDVPTWLSNDPVWNLRRGTTIHPTSPALLYKMTKPGQSFSKTIEKLGYTAARWNYIRLNYAAPSATVAATPTLFHPTEARWLSCAEIFRLSSFPDDYVATTPALGRYMAGMSVPPFMARAVAHAVKEQWLLDLAKRATPA